MLNVKKLILNKYIYIFIIIACITIINDNIIYFLKLNYEISLLISSILVIIPNIVLIRKKVIEIKTDFSKLDLIAIIPYIIIYFIIILHIDDFIDTISYHLYNQKNPFIDKINFDLLPRSTTFFPLGDRMNYIFVRFFGYRLGNVLSLYSAITIFYQVKRFLKIIVPEMKEKLVIIFSSIILYTFSVNLCIGEYSIDIFSVVILLELLHIAIKKNKYFENKKYLFLSFLLAGISIGIKMSNIIFSGVLLAYILFKYYKNLRNIKLHDIVICIFLLIIPFGVYMLNNYIQTQNPIFPFANSFFHSNYYEECSARDERLGPKNIIETLIWPIIIGIDYLRGDDIRGLVDPIWQTGYVLLIYCLINKKKNREILDLLILSSILTAVWIVFVSGYVRYAMFIAIVYFLIEIYVLYKIVMELKKEKSNVLNLSLNFLLIFMILIQLIFSVFIGGIYILEKIKISLGDIFYDIDEDTVSGKYDIEGVWIASRYNTSCIDLIRTDDTPMYNTDLIVEIDPMMNIKNNYSKLSQETFYKKIERKKIIYCYK